jgi:hypothetical protein
MDVDAGRAVAFRLGAQHVSERVAAPDAALRGWAVQDSPPGAATAAVLARTDDIQVGWVDAGLHEHRSLVALYNARTATAVLPGDEAAAYGTALIPDDDAGLRAIVGPALRDRREGFAAPVALAVEAVSDALDGTVLSRDALHEELRQRLPIELLPWCPGCQSHHARRGLLVMAALHGRLCLAGRAGRQPAFARTDQWRGWDVPPRTEAGADLVRRYLAGYAPSTPAHFAQWAGLGTAHARALWGLVEDELAPVRVDGGTRAWALERDLPRLRDPAPPDGVRLLAAGDPLLLARDRETLVADQPARREVWRAIGGAGVVLDGARAVAVWRAQKKGRRLVVRVRAFADAFSRDAVGAEAERLAPHRGCTSVELDWC